MWYRVLKAAQYLGVAPWALEGRSVSWMLQAEAAQAAEQYAETNRARTGRREA